MAKRASPSWPDHDQYQLRISGAHQRRTLPITAPTLVRHLCLWQSFTKGDEDTEEVDYTKIEDELIAAIYHKLLESNDILPKQRSGTQSGGYKNLLKGRFIKQNDSRVTPLFRSLMTDGGTLIGHDCQDHRQDGNCPSRFRTIIFEFIWSKASCAIQFESYIDYLAITFTAAVPKSAGKVHDNIIAALQRLLTPDASPNYALSNLLYEQFWDEFDKKLLAISADGDFGRRVADFRGLIVDDSCLPHSGSTGASIAPNGKLDPNLNRLWELTASYSSRNSEFTASTMIDNQALFATNMGANLNGSSGGSSGGSSTIRYLLFSKLDNPHQLGRLVSKLHRAGSARIAAAMHFEQLNLVGKALRKVEAALEKGLFPSTDTQEQGRLQAIKSMAENAIPHVDVDGSIPYRVERSRHYAAEFETVVKGLRIGRVPGFQPYDEFVRQRMQSAFDYIAGVGSRYALVQSGISELYRREQISQGLSYTNAIEKAQKTADIALWAVLAPYYAGSTASHLVGHHVPEWFSILLWLSFIAAGLMFATYLIVREKKRGEPWGTRARWLMVSLLLALTLAVLGWSGILHGSAHPPAPSDNAAATAPAAADSPAAKEDHP